MYTLTYHRGMPVISTNLTQEEHDRLMNVLPETGKTVYAFVKDAIETQVRQLEEGKPVATAPIVVEMVEALRGRKWYLHQLEDFSDRNHKLWLEGRFRRASKSDILDAIALFRTKKV